VAPKRSHRCFPFEEEGPLKGIAILGIVLIIVWIMGFVVFKLAGFLIHLLLIAGAILLIVGLVRRVRGGVSSRL
jgi:hypothetical protein